MTGCPERRAGLAVSTARLAYRKTQAHDPSFVREGQMSSRLLILLVPAALLLQTSVGYADAIDGDWCSTDGMRMSISGEKITIPIGKQIEGNYSRHAFDYVVPAGENGFGRCREYHPAERVSCAVAARAGRGTIEGMASLQGKHQLNAIMRHSEMIFD